MNNTGSPALYRRNARRQPRAGEGGVKKSLDRHLGFRRHMVRKWNNELTAARGAGPRSGPLWVTNRGSRVDLRSFFARELRSAGWVDRSM